MGDIVTKPRLLLTGGGGLVGRNILEHATALRWDILAPRSAELDLTDRVATRDYVSRVQPDVIIHSAGRVGGIHANIAHPVAFLVENLDMGRNIVMAARDASVPRLLNLASSCMYPREAKNPLREDAILTGELEPTNEGYALAKIATMRLCQYIRREAPSLAYKTLIPCNIFGRHDKFDPAVSHMVPAVIAKVHQAKVQGDDMITVWGDGTARREFMYAGDLADAVWRVVDDLDHIPDLMNIGLGQDYSINEYYHAVCDVVGWQGILEHDLSKPVGMARKQVDISRQSDWGWRPAHDLRSGIAKTYDYYLKEAVQ